MKNSFPKLHAGITVAIIACLGLAVSAPAAETLSLESILLRLAVFERGGGEEPLYQLREYVLARKDSPPERQACEEAFVTFLSGKATLAGKMAVCRQLRLIGSARSVAVLVRMLANPPTADMARYALENIPAPEADTALIAALKTSSGLMRTGIISSLGQRQAPGAAAALGRLLDDPDRQTTIAASNALGQIADTEAAGILAAALNRQREPLKSSVASALLHCAEIRLAHNRPADALDLCARVLTAAVPVPLRQAALRGKIAAAGSQAPRLILAALSGRDASLHEPAIVMVPLMLAAADLPPLCRLLPALPARAQCQLLVALAGYPRQSVLATVTAAVASRQLQVRLEALRILEKIGDASTVPLLAERAARARGEEQAAARASLWGVHGADADRAILDLLASASPDMRSELIQAVAERRIPAGKARLLELARSSEAADRLAAIRGLRLLAGADDLPLLLNLLSGLNEETEKEEMENTAAAVALTIERSDTRANAVKSLLARTPAVHERGPLLRVLGKIGDDSSLPLLRQTLAGNNAELADAAVRALADWPTVTARDDLLAIARTAPGLTQRVLALRAFVRLTGLERYRRPQAVVESLREALQLAGRADERRLVLGLLGDFPCAEALQLAESLATDAEVGAEARAAAEKISQQLKNPGG